MPREGSVTFADLDFEKLEVACPKCSRQGEYLVEALKATHGAHFRLTDFLALVSEDCPKRTSPGIADSCAAIFPQLRS